MATSPHIDLKKVRNLLVVHFGDLSDMVLTIPLLRALHEAMPTARITVVCRPPVASLLEGCPYIERLIAHEPSNHGSIRLAWESLRLARQELWQRRYDLAVAPSIDPDPAAAFIAWYSRAPWRVSAPPGEVCHDVRRYLEIAQHLTGEDLADDRLRLWLTDEDHRRAAECLALLPDLPQKGDTPLIALGLGASHPRRQWPLDRFIALGRWLIDDCGAAVLAVGGEDDFYLGRELAEALGPRAINSAGRLAPRALAALLARCDAYVGNDTHAMYLAAAMGTPCVEISCHPLSASPSHACAVDRRHPWGVAYRALQPRHALAPCENHCVDAVPHCILAITVEQTQAAFEDLMVHGDRPDRARCVAGVPGIPRAASIAALPAITVVVPVLNEAAALERTLQCLVDQRYPHLEIIVVDGGSTDGSIEVIQEFGPHIAWWCSEPDAGPAHAINKGFAHATGLIANWLCAGDMLADEALRKIGEHFAVYPEIDALVGRTRHVFAEHRLKDFVDQPTLEAIGLIPIGRAFNRRSCFYRRKLLESRASPLVESFRHVMDLELWAHFNQQGARWMVIHDMLGEVHDFELPTRARAELITYELERVYRRYCFDRVPLTWWHRWLRHPLERYRRRHPGWRGKLAYPLQLLLLLGLSPFYGYRRVRAMNWESLS